MNQSHTERKDHKMDTDHKLTDTHEAALERLGAQMDEPEVKEWLAIRKEAGLVIDPATAVVDSWYAVTWDPYGVYREQVPEDCRRVGREYFARSPESDVWVSFDDLPEDVLKKIWQRLAADDYARPAVSAEEVCAILDPLPSGTQITIERSPAGLFRLMIQGTPMRAE